MHFSKSERALHQLNQFNPPCNAYQKTELVALGSVRPQNGFGLTTRFRPLSRGSPGPATYNLQPKLQEGQAKRSLKKARMGIECSPSIPFAYFGDNLDPEDHKFVRELLISEDALKSAMSTKKKQAVFSFPREKRSITTTISKQKEPSQFKSAADTPQKPLPHTQTLRESTRRRKEVISMISPDYVPCLQIIELMGKRRERASPGPGHYASETARLASPAPVFNSTDRFPSEKMGTVGPGSYNLHSSASQRGIQFDRTSRNVFNIKEHDDLNHRFYIDPQIVDILDSKIATREVPHPFGSCVARFNSRAETEKPVLIKPTVRLEKMIERRLKERGRAKEIETDCQGLLGLSTMASVVD